MITIHWFFFAILCGLAAGGLVCLGAFVYWSIISADGKVYEQERRQRNG